MNRPASAGRLLGAIVLLAGLGTAGGASAKDLVPLVRGLPWPHVSQLIGYDGRMWFANSRKFVNHNSADLYSFDPATGTSRYERHLFSQDVGDPAIVGGLLYWPFEDSRWSPGRGEFAITDGERWRWGLLAEGTAFHIHAMTGHAGSVYAAPSAWKAHLQRSSDGGTTWGTAYVHPAPQNRINRLVALASFGGALWAGLTAWHDPGSPKLLRLTDDGMKRLADWPAGASVPRLVTFGDWLYGRNVTQGSASVWRTDGRRVQRIGALDGVRITDLAAGTEAIWAISADGTGPGGALWRSTDGLDWRMYQAFANARPIAVGVHADKVYVGARGQDGGMLFGPKDRTKPVARHAKAALPRGRPRPTEPLATSLERLDRVLSEPDQYRRLRAAALPIALHDGLRAGRALQDRLARPMPAGNAPMLGGSLSVPAEKMARWYLLWAMAHDGHGRVPPEWLSLPWTQSANRAEKYVGLPPGAATAAAELGQTDTETLAALIDRLDRKGDPLWLRGDFIGALTTLTNQHYGYDVAAWQDWWRSNRH